MFSGYVAASLRVRGNHVSSFFRFKSTLKATPKGIEVSGFKCAGVTAGLKPSGKPDLAIFHSVVPASAAGCFTKNLFCAAPVILDRKILESNPDTIQTVVINAGQANACTGKQGLENGQKMIDHIENLFSGDALIMSTGVIGRQLDLPKVVSGIDKAAEKLDGSVASWEAASRSIMTTDTVPKLSSIKFNVGSTEVSIIGTSKGAGMIHPNMATMLGVLCTNASITPECLQKALSYAVNRTYNCIDVDGDTSTNDSVIVLANGTAKNAKISDSNSEEFIQFRDGLTAVARCLSKQLVRDGEGATKFITIRVFGAQKEADAFRVAQSIARSSLVKCAMFGKDPNWGRIVCAVGYSGVEINPEKVNLFFSRGDEEDLDNFTREQVQIVKEGQPLDGVLEKCSSVLQEVNIIVEVDLGLGDEEAIVWTCDLSDKYVMINSDYTT